VPTLTLVSTIAGVKDGEKRALLLAASCALAGSASTPEVENARLGELLLLYSACMHSKQPTYCKLNSVERMYEHLYVCDWCCAP
jgi:hypothetical protein